MGPTPFLLLLKIAKKLRRKVFLYYFSNFAPVSTQTMKIKTVSSNRESGSEENGRSGLSNFYELKQLKERKKKVQNVSNVQNL